MSELLPTTIKMKVERAFVEYFKANAPGRLKGLPVIGGHDNAEPEGGYLSIYCRKPLENPELGPRSREYLAPLNLLLQLPTDQAAQGRLEEACEAAKDLMEDMVAIRAALNWPGQGTPDRRKVRGFHVTDVHPGEEDDDRLADERQDFFALNYVILCADFDSPPTS